MDSSTLARFTGAGIDSGADISNGLLCSRDDDRVEVAPFLLLSLVGFEDEVRGILSMSRLTTQFRLDEVGSV